MTTYTALIKLSTVSGVNKTKFSRPRTRPRPLLTRPRPRPRPRPRL